MTLINGLEISAEEASSGAMSKACRWVVVETVMLCVGNLFDSGETCYFHHKYELNCGGGSTGGGGDDPGEPDDEDIGSGGSGGNSIVGSPIVGTCLENNTCECPPGYLLNRNGECEENPVIGADCRSFEYAQAPGSSIKACAVTNFNNNFYYGFTRPDGSWQAGYFPLNNSLIYFTMPTWMTNGYAANLTAEAVSGAILLTDLYVLDNASDELTLQQVISEFSNNLRNAMNAIGGDVTATAPFLIPSPAPYLINIGGATTDCN